MNERKPILGNPVGTTLNPAMLGGGGGEGGASMIISASEYTALDRLTIEANALIDEVTKKLENGEFDGVGIKNIARTAGTGSPGTRDTYTVTMTDDTTYTFTVYNGANGIGGGGGGEGGPSMIISASKPYVNNCFWFNTSKVPPTIDTTTTAVLGVAVIGEMILGTQ